MLNYVDRTIVDARGFTKQRSGLAWELTQVIIKMPANRFLILTNIYTDIRYLNETIANISEVRAFPDSGKVRIVNLGWPDHKNDKDFKKWLYLKADVLLPLFD